MRGAGRSGEHEQHAVGAALRLGRQRSFSSTRSCRRTCAGKCRRRSTRLIPLSAHYNAEVAPTRKRCSATARPGAARPGRSGRAPDATGARQHRDGLPDLPHLLGDELFRLPPADEGEPARAAEQIRRRDDRAISPPTIRRSCATTSSCSASTAR